MLKPLTFESQSTDSSSSSNKSSSPMGMSRLDLAKMMVEQIVKMMDRRVYDHNLRLQTEANSNNPPLKGLCNLGFAPKDQFLLLSTACPSNHKESNETFSPFACGAGGRLLVGFATVSSSETTESSSTTAKATQNDTIQTNIQQIQHQQKQKIEFDKQLKRLRANPWKSCENNQKLPFPEDGGGAHGLNIALSTGLQLLSRHRLQNRYTENFGMGRLLTNFHLAPNTNGTMQQATCALQPACLILLTDGECLVRPSDEGGGSLQLQFGNIPLKEFYREPFRWDQRLFCIGVGPNADNLHGSLKAFSEVSGGCHIALKLTQDIIPKANSLMKIIAPPLPSTWPIENPLRLPYSSHSMDTTKHKNTMSVNGEVFVNGGPVVCFQSTGDAQSILHRAMLLYVPCWKNDNMKNIGSINAQHLASPIWMIPETYWPSNKKMDSLPPRNAQPILNYTKHYHNEAAKVNLFDPMTVMKMLDHLDQLIASNRSLSQQNVCKLLQRDVYLCQWLSLDERTLPRGPTDSIAQNQYLPVFVRGAGRSSFSDGDDNVLNIGILFVSSDPKVPSTLTLLPPEPHIILPLLIRAAEAEHRQLKKASLNKEQNTVTNTSKNIIMDETFRTDLRAYIYRIPPYYHPAIKRSLTIILPSSVHSILSLESESALSQCLPRNVIQKIKFAEQISKETNDDLSRREDEYRRYTTEANLDIDKHPIRYGHYDPRSSIATYLTILRSLPAPSKQNEDSEEKSNDLNMEEINSPFQVTDCVGSLPKRCLLAFYESRRRWIFGGEGLTTKGLSVDGVKTSSSCHRYSATHSVDDESLLSLVGVGASRVNTAPISQMGDFKERLLFSRQPIVGIGSNNSCISPVTTKPDGSPTTSLSDEDISSVLFDQNTGDFVDSSLAKMRAAVMINFGNPFKVPMGDSIVPEKFASQRPPRKHPTSEQAFSPPHGKLTQNALTMFIVFSRVS